MINSSDLNTNKSNTPPNNHFGAYGFCLAIFLFILYLNVIGLYGLKFATGTIISFLTGASIWFIRVLFQRGDDPDGVDKPFCWFMFLLFPLFIPLALPLWLIPTILIITYLITITSFGGYGKQIFNPVIVAVVFLLYGYGDIGLTEPSRPFPNGDEGYKIWTAGIPPRTDIRKIYASISPDESFWASLKGKIPSIPGSCYGSVILLASLAFAVIFKRKLIWLSTNVLSIYVLVYLMMRLNRFSIPPNNLLFLGIMPSLILCGISDLSTLPESAKGQIISSILFVFFALIMIFYTSSVLAPAYGFLIAQVVTPLVLDIFGMSKNE